MRAGVDASGRGGERKTRGQWSIAVDEGAAAGDTSRALQHTSRADVLPGLFKTEKQKTRKREKGEKERLTEIVSFALERGAEEEMPVCLASAEPSGPR